MIKEKNENLDRMINKNIDKIIKRDDAIVDISDTYKNEYNFDNDNNILKSFGKIYRKYNIYYEPRDSSKSIRVRYLLKKLKEDNNVPRNLYNYFHANMSDSSKLYCKIPICEEKEQTGSSVNNIIINDKDLDNGILRVRYLNNRKLTNN